MDNETLHRAKKHRDYWIGRAQELQSKPHQLADEILEFADREVKNCSIPVVVGQSEQLCQFERDDRTSSATICKHCGKERWEH